jgi:hypothetical protein
VVGGRAVGQAGGGGVLWRGTEERTDAVDCDDARADDDLAARREPRPHHSHPQPPHRRLPAAVPMTIRRRGGRGCGLGYLVGVGVEAWAGCCQSEGEEWSRPEGTRGVDGWKVKEGRRDGMGGAMEWAASWNRRVGDS